MDLNEKMLTIKQAAEFLNVSPMSLRRWTNSGKLKCYRVGLKKERRFKLSDLEDFLVENDGGSQNIILGIEDMVAPAHAHISHFYSTEEACMEAGIGYLRQGLAKGEVVLAMSPAKRRPRLLAALEESGYPVSVLQNQGSFRVCEGMENAKEQVVMVNQFMDRAQREGRFFRLLGDMVWTVERGWDLEQLYELEKGTNQQRENVPSVFLCQYDISAFSADVAFMAMQTHNFTIYNQHLNQSPYFALAPSWSPSQGS
ncbi:MAG: MEDS domain-containing protein [Deltaproteobacteria bacterium]|nr:MEDS domain-containing protein [Deltaproteobacteria bacterium]